MSTDVFFETLSKIPLDTRRKWNVFKSFRRQPGRLLKVFCMFTLRPVFRGFIIKVFLSAEGISEL